MKTFHWAREGLKEVELVTDPKSGLWFRPGSSDMDMIKTTLNKEYNTVNCSGHVCLDLGANVGSFILKAAKDGAKEVVSWEPEPYNCEVLKLNSELIAKEYPNMRVEVFNAAIGKETGNLQFNVNPGSNSACSGSLVTKKKKNRIAVDVAVHSFSDAVNKYKPTLVKMDIEGAEYQCLEGYEFPDHVTEFIVELHGFSKANEAMMYKFYEQYANTWTVVNKSEKIAFMKIALITAHFRR